MKVKYLIDALLVDDVSGELTWKPIGVWAVEVGATTLAFEWKYLPGNPEREAESDRIATALVENGVDRIPEDFLEYYKVSYNSYIGQFYGQFEGEYVNLPACCDEVLSKIMQGKFGN